MSFSDKSIKKNFVYNTILTVVNIIFPLITFPYISRVLLVEAYGKVEFALSVINYFLMFSALGIPVYGIRECSRVRDDKQKLSKVVHELLLINIVMTVFSYLVFIILVLNVPRFSQDKTLFFVCSINLLLNFTGMNWLFSALEEYRFISIRAVLVKGISFLTIILMVKQQDDFIIYAGLMAFANVGANIFNLLYSRKFVIFKHMSEYNFRRHIRPILILFASTVAISIYTNLNTLMLGFLSGDVEVGYYGAGNKIRSTIGVLIVSLSTVLLPRMSYLASTKKMDELKKLLVKSFHFLFLISFPAIVYFTVFAKNFILFFAGEKYLGAVLPTQILVISLLCAGATGITGTQILVPLLKEKEFFVSIAIAAVIDMLLNLFFIPKWGSVGAALSAAIAEMVVLVVQLFQTREICFSLKIKRYMALPALSSAIAIGITVVVMSRIDISIFLQVFISASMFFAIYGIILCIGREEMILEIMHRAISRVIADKKK